MVGDPLWRDPDGLRWRVSLEYAGHGRPGVEDSPFALAWICDEGEPRAFLAPAPLAPDLQELSGSQLAPIWRRFCRSSRLMRFDHWGDGFPGGSVLPSAAEILGGLP